MQKPLILMFFPVICAHMGDTKFQYSNKIWKELCDIWAN